MDNKFEIINEKNEKETYEILKTFNIDNDNYIVYTDNTLTDQGNLDVIINKYEINNGNIVLLEIPEEKRKYVDDMWSLLCQDV
ncbi:MAG: DUF1292 domain-containing protein [Mycoplasma sp.]|nr:DUF1292 domain-containing protein [Mycoplasma sp.]MDD7150227.1 DUF1292 domain-containing protein [Mycoplasma sp.]MDY4544839.1 hypothetical protein [Bacilli bacterium]MDY4619580.1 hypothetical protein [Bacilli bacterium]